MSIEEIKRKISLGENIAVEFKRCGNGMQKDVYETVCSFSNRFGGDIFCGVLDDGAIEGIPEGAAQDEWPFTRMKIIRGKTFPTWNYCEAQDFLEKIWKQEKKA